MNTYFLTQRHGDTERQILGKRRLAASCMSHAPGIPVSSCLYVESQDVLLKRRDAASPRGFGITAKDKSFYFRNALVRANYENQRLGVDKTNLPLEEFFKVLLFGYDIELKNRYLRIGQEYGTKAAEAISGLHRRKKPVDVGANVGVNVGVNVGANVGANPLNGTEELAVKAILRNKRIKAVDLAKILGMSKRQAERVIAALKVKANLKRNGADKNGEWYFDFEKDNA